MKLVTDILLIILLSIFGGPLWAHQFVPTYPQFSASYVEGISQTKMELFNKRRDVEYYELGVFTSTWAPITFSSDTRLIRIRYLETKKINIYVRNEDVKKVTYICTESRLRKEDVNNTVPAVASRICSKVK